MLKKLWDLQRLKVLLEKSTFEHNIATGLGRAHKSLPRDYLLRGMFTPEAFNLAKRDVFDAPLVRLMEEYKRTGKGEEQIKALIQRFNDSTEGYAKDLVFEDGKLKMLTETADIEKYIDPSRSTQEFLKTSQMGKGLPDVCSWI